MTRSPGRSTRSMNCAIVSRARGVVNCVTFTSSNTMKNQRPAASGRCSLVDTRIRPCGVGARRRQGDRVECGDLLTHAIFPDREVFRVEGPGQDCPAAIEHDSVNRDEVDARGKGRLLRDPIASRPRRGARMMTAERCVCRTKEKGADCSAPFTIRLPSESRSQTSTSRTARRSGSRTAPGTRSWTSRRQLIGCPKFGFSTPKVISDQLVVVQCRPAVEQVEDIRQQRHAPPRTELEAVIRVQIDRRLDGRPAS